MSIAVIIPVILPPFVGKGLNRLFARVDSREVFLRSVELYGRRDEISQRIVVATPDDLGEMAERYSAHLGFQGVTVTGGGSDWFNCVARGLEKLDAEIETVIVQDASCPAVPFTLIDALLEALASKKALVGVVPVLPSRNAFADMEGAVISEYVDMAKVMEVQTPQAFRRAAIEKAYQARGDDKFMDDAELVMAKTGGKIGTVPGSRLNQRIDSDEMVRLAKDLFEHLPKRKSRTPLNPFGEAEW